MPLSGYALLTLAELKEHLAITGTGQDAQLETVINDVTDDLERFLGRQIVTRTTALTEYHTLRGWLGELRPRQWPIITITSISEDTAWPRAYGTALVADTDYQIVKGQRDVLRRLGSGGGSAYWALGVRTVKLVYTAGYANTAAVPARIKIQAKRYAALLFREIDRKIQGVQTQNDGLGNFTRFAPAGITDQMKEALMDERRLELYETGDAA